MGMARGLVLVAWLLRVQSLQLSPEVTTAIQRLQDFDKAYIARMSEGRLAGLAPQAVEFQRAQKLKKEGLRIEREALRASILTVTKNSKSVIFGIMAESGERGLEVLRAWTQGLELPRRTLLAVDDITNREIELASLDEASVYVKYDSGKGGDAYMKRYAGEFTGVILQPVLADDEFRQFGNFPVALF